MGGEVELDAMLEVLRGAEEIGYIGEPVSQFQHALQAAYFAGEKCGGTDEPLVLAALFHDIGHLAVGGGEGLVAEMPGGLGVSEHEKIGAEWLRRIGFSERVCKLVELHVQAKRYRVSRDPKYLERLSSASLKTLKLQGGPMNPEEAAEFEASPYYAGALLLRSADERAKVPGLPVPPLSHYRGLMRRNLTAEQKEKKKEK